MLAHLKEKNPSLTLFTAEDSRMKPYGRRVDGLTVAPVMEAANTFEIGDGVQYVTEDAKLAQAADVRQAELAVYGGMPIQVGLCWGRSTKLNGLEWHKGSELIIAATDIVLLLGQYADLDFSGPVPTYDTKNIIGLYVPKGQAVELNPGVLHLAPCQVSDDGFRALILLPKGTNEKLEEPAPEVWLRAVNKWLILHEGAGGDLATMKGENIELLY